MFIDRIQHFTQLSEYWHNACIAVLLYNYTCMHGLTLYNNSFIVFLQSLILYGSIYGKILMHVQPLSLLLLWVFYCLTKLARLLIQLNNLLWYLRCLLLVKDTCHVCNAYNYLYIHTCGWIF